MQSMTNGELIGTGKYRVIVNEWYKIKQGTRRQIWFFQVSTCIPRKWILEHLISMQYFAAHSTYLLIMGGVPNSPIWHFRFTSPFQRTRLNELFWSMKKLCQSSVRRASRKQFCHLHPKRLLLGWHFNDYLTNSRTLVPWNLSTQLEEGSGLRNRLKGSKTSLWCTPMFAWQTHRSSNIGFRAVWKTVLLFRYLSQASNGVHREELFDHVDLFLCPPSLLPVDCSGFRDPVFLNRSSSR